jgi:hypothetical protein
VPVTGGGTHLDERPYDLRDAVCLPTDGPRAMLPGARGPLPHACPLNPLVRLPVRNPESPPMRRPSAMVPGTSGPHTCWPYILDFEDEMLRVSQGWWFAMTNDLTASRRVARAIERERPHRALLKVVNPVFAALLRSPLHGLLDATFRPRLLVLDITGRKTGRRYRVVVGCHESDGVVSVFTSMPWRVNTRGGADVAVTYDGRTSRARAVLVEDPDEVADAYGAEIQRIGWKAAQRQLGMKINVRRAPTRAELVEAASREHLSLIRLQPG